MDKVIDIRSRRPLPDRPDPWDIGPDPWDISPDIEVNPTDDIARAAAKLNHVLATVGPRMTAGQRYVLTSLIDRTQLLFDEVLAWQENNT